MIRRVAVALLLVAACGRHHYPRTSLTCLHTIAGVTEVNPPLDY